MTTHFATPFTANGPGHASDRSLNQWANATQISTVGAQSATASLVVVGRPRSCALG